MKNLNFLRFATRLALLLAVVVSLGLSANAQVTVPDGFQYQAIARDANGVALTGASIAVQFTVTDDNGFNNVETHNVMTNDFGLFNLVAGAGVDFEGLVNPMINVQIDLGAGFVDMGTVPFQSVPYAAVAGNVAYVDNGMLHVGNDVFNVGNFFTGTPGIVEPLEAVVVDANKSIEGFGDVSTDGTLSVGSTIEAQDYVRILSTANNTYGNWQSGALQVKGGAGIANDVWIGGDIVIGGSITGLSLAVTNGITAGGDITGGGDLHITDIYAAGNAYITGDLEAANIMTGMITASSVYADDFYGNFHGGTLDLGAAKSVTVNDILTATADNDAALVTAGAVYDADMVLQANIDDNTALIGSNLVLISDNAAAIAVNAANITANDSDIAANAAAIAANAAAIAQNAANIASNDSDIAANALAIQANANAIAVNAANIASNDSDIAANVVAIASNAADIAQNAADIAQNTTWINSNYDLIMSNAADIASNAADIASTWAFIEDDLDLQWVYENGHEINIMDNNPVQIYSDNLYGGLDVIASGDAEIAIDAKLSGSTATEHTTIQANLDDAYVAQLGASDGVNHVAVYGLITANNVYGALGATVEVAGVDKHYAGYFNGNAYVKSELTVSESGYIYLNNTIGSGDANSGAMVVKGGVGIGENLNVAADVNVGLDLFVARNTVLGDDIASDLFTVNAISTLNGPTTINNTLDVTGAVWMGSTLDVDGATTLNSTLNVSDVATFESDVYANEDLYVAGNTEMTGYLDVDGATTLNNTLDVDGATTLNNTLDVDGATTLNNTLNVAGAAHFESPVTMSSTLDVDGATALNSTLDVDGATTLNNTLTVANSATFNGDATFNANLDVNDTFTLSSVEGDVDELMIGQGTGNTPVWTSVADLMEDLTDGQGIVDFTYDGSTPATVTADIDMETLEFDLDDKIQVDEDYAFNWTNTHTFFSEVNVEGYIHNSVGVLQIMDDAYVSGAFEVDGATTINNTATVSDLLTAGSLHVLGTSALDGDVTAGANLDVALTVTASEVVANLGNITTVNSTTGNITTVNSTTGNITTVNATTVNADLVDATVVDVDNLDINTDIDFDGVNITEIDTDSEVPLLDGDDNSLPTSGAVYQHVEDRFDVLYFQELYDNAVLSGNLDNLHIDATDGPLQIYAPTANGGLDVYASDVAEDAIDARLTTTATDAAVVQAILDGTIYGYLGGKMSTGETAAVYGNDGANWGAIAYTTGAKAAYAGYFNGNVYMTEDLYVDNNVEVGESGTVHVNNEANATNDQTGALVVDGGVGIGQDLYVGGQVDIGTQLLVGTDATIGDDLIVGDDTYLGDDATFDVLVVNAVTTINGETTVDDNFIVTGTSDLQGDVTAGSNLTVEGNTALNGTLTVSGASTFNNTAEFNGDATFNANLDVTETFSLDGIEGGVDELMIGTGSGTTPVWITVADLMEDLTDGAGIEDFTYDGSAPMVVEASIDGETIIFTGTDSDITVNEGWAFTWTALHTFENNIDAQGTIYNSMDVLTLDDDVLVNGTLTVSDAAQFNSTVEVDGATTLNSTLDVVGATTLESTLEVDGTSQFNAPVTTTSDVTVGEDLHVMGNTQLDGTLVTEGTAEFNSTLTASGEITAETTLHVVGTSALDGVVTTLSDVFVGGDLDVDNDATIAGSALIETDLTVLGSTTLGTACTDLLTVNAAANFLCDVDFDANINVDGTTTLNGLLTVNAATDLNGTLSVSDVATFSSDIVALADIDAQGVIYNSDGDLTIDDNAVVNGTFTASEAAQFNSTVNIDGATTVNNTLYVDGATTLNNTLTVSGATDLNNTLNVAGLLTAETNLHVMGTSQLDGVVTTGSDVNVGADLDVVGDAHIAGSTTIDTDLTVLGSATFGTTCSDTFLVQSAAEFLCDVEFTCIILDDETICEVRNVVEGIRTDGTATDGAIATEAAIADWLPATRGVAQSRKALVLNSSDAIVPGTSGGFDMNLGTGDLRSQTVTTYTAQVNGTFTATGATTNLGGTNISGALLATGASQFDGQTTLKELVYAPTNSPAYSSSQAISGTEHMVVFAPTIPGVTATLNDGTGVQDGQIVTILNSGSASLTVAAAAPATLAGATTIAAGTATRYIYYSGTWYPVN